MARLIDGFVGIHGGYGEYTRNLEGRMLLVLPRKRIVYQIHGLKERKSGG